MGFNKQKLKTNLKLAINRLKLLEKKKTELAQKARREIAEYLTNGKDERARIRVEHIIREDYLVEGMELLELYADLLLARFGLIESMSYCDEGMVEAVTTLIWAAPRLQTDVQELKIIADQLGLKFGKKFAHEASNNTNETVNERLILKLSPKPPPKILVERYLVEIARSHNVPFEPDPAVMEANDLDLPSVDDMRKPGGGSYGGGGGGQIGFEPFAGGTIQGNTIPGIPAMTGGHASFAYPPAPQGPAPPYTQSNPVDPADLHLMEKKVPPYPGNDPLGPRPGLPNSPSPSAPPPTAGNGPSIPSLPTVPTDNLPSSVPFGGASAGGEDVDFDDLTRRFEELKKKK